MSNIDALVTKDLAAAATANRDRLRTLDDTLRAVAPAESVAVPRTTTMTDLRMLALADVFAGRVARMAAGAAALASVVLVASALVAWTVDVGPRDLVELLIDNTITLVMRFAIGILGVHILAGAVARSMFARAVAEDPASGDVLNARIDRWAVALSIAGPFVFVMVFGIAFVTLGYDRVALFACSLDTDCRGVGFDEAMYIDRLWDLAFVVPLGVVASLAIAALVRRGPAPKSRNLFERGRTLAVGCVVLAVTIALGIRFDAGVWQTDAHGMFASPDNFLRRALTIPGAIGLVWTLSSLALWRRRRELQRIASASSRS